MKAMKNIKKYLLFFILIGISIIVMINLYPIKEGAKFRDFVERAHEALPEHDVNDSHDNLIRVDTVQLDDSEEIDEKDPIEVQVGDYKTFVEDTTETELPSTAEAEIPVNDSDWGQALDFLVERRGRRTWWGRNHDSNWH